MDEHEVLQLLEAALQALASRDEHLLVNDLSERCIAARLAMHLQPLFAAHDDSLSVDVEYNRVDDIVKAVTLPDDCSRWRNREGHTRVVPDVIVHRRGGAGPNLLVIELKKTSNPAQLNCDRVRVAAFRAQLGYSYRGACRMRDAQGRAARRQARGMGHLISSRKGSPPAWAATALQARSAATQHQRRRANRARSPGDWGSGEGDLPKARELLLSFQLTGSARLLQTFRRIFSIGLPLASSSISLSR